MMNLRNIYSIAIPAQVEDVRFLAPDVVVYSTRNTEIHSVDLRNPQADSSVLFSRDDIMLPIARAMSVSVDVLTNGACNRIQASSAKNKIVINTHDMVLLACDAGRVQPPRIISLVWGLYSPDIQFSSDGDWLFARSDYCIVFETNAWACIQLDAMEACAWHPAEPILFAVTSDGKLIQWDFQLGLEGSRPVVICDIGRDFALNEVERITLDFGGNRCNIISSDGAIERFLLNPFRYLGQERIDVGYIEDLQQSRDGKLLGIENLVGVKILDSADLSSEMLSIPNATMPRFSVNDDKLLVIRKALQGNEVMPSLGCSAILEIFKIEI